MMMPTLWKQMYIDSEKVLKPKPIQVKKGVLTATPYTFKIDDYVRLSFTKYLFQREYHQRWSDEVFIVKQRVRRDNIPLYKVKDWNGDIVEGWWYTSELQKIDKEQDDLWKVEKVLERRKVRGKGQSLVKFLNWPKKFNMWIRDENLVDI